MTVVASIALAPSSFALGRAFEAVPDVPVTAESVVPISPATMPYFWVERADGTAVVERLREAELVADVTVLDETGSRLLLEIAWVEQPDDVLPVMHDTDAAVLDAVRQSGEWVFRLRFPAYDSLSTFNQRCRERGVDVSLKQVYRSSTASGTRDGLTAEQREVLATALDAGYFEVPRETTLRELGDTLGISDSAASQRLRRGLSTLLSGPLRSGENDDDAE